MLRRVKTGLFVPARGTESAAAKRARVTTVDPARPGPLVRPSARSSVRGSSASAPVPRNARPRRGRLRVHRVSLGARRSPLREALGRPTPGAAPRVPLPAGNRPPGLGDSARRSRCRCGDHAAARVDRQRPRIPVGRRYCRPALRDRRGRPPHRGIYVQRRARGRRSVDGRSRLRSARLAARRPRVARRSGSTGRVRAADEAVWLRWSGRCRGGRDPGSAECTSPPGKNCSCPRLSRSPPHRGRVRRMAARLALVLVGSGRLPLQRCGERDLIRRSRRLFHAVTPGRLARRDPAGDRGLCRGAGVASTREDRASHRLARRGSRRIQPWWPVLAALLRSARAATLTACGDRDHEPRGSPTGVRRGGCRRVPGAPVRREARTRPRSTQRSHDLVRVRLRERPAACEVRPLALDGARHGPCARVAGRFLLPGRSKAGDTVHLGSSAPRDSGCPAKA